MAPRGRQKRDKRMDAAVETMMQEYGIPDVKLIKKVAKKLLDVYGGGDDAWCFIEKYTYLELFEAIVRGNNEQVNSSGGGDSVECGTAENHAPKDAAGPSSVVAEPICAEVENELEKDTKADTNHLPSTERDGKGWKDIGMDEFPSQREISDALCGEKSGSNEDPEVGSMLFRAQLPAAPLTTSMPSRPNTSPLLSPLSSIHSPATANSAPNQRRLPCYGWIESDEEYVDDIIELRPAKQVTATITKSLEYKSCGMDRKAKRRSRWDVRPNDP